MRSTDEEEMSTMRSEERRAILFFYGFGERGEWAPWKKGLGDLLGLGGVECIHIYVGVLKAVGESLSFTLDFQGPDGRSDAC